VNGENYIMRSLMICTAHLIFGHRRDEVTGKWRKLYNEELN
jgi:hypothetical protein